MFTYVHYIQANETLFKCYEAVKPEDYDALSSDDQREVCRSEWEEVESILNSGKLRFKELVSERLSLN